MSQASPNVPVADPQRPAKSSAVVRHERLGRTETVGREIGRWGELGGEGPLLLILGGVHGNEPAGVLAALDVLAELGEREPAALGGVVALAGNLAALDTGCRFVHEDLNRAAHADTLARLRDEQAREPVGRAPLAGSEENELLRLMDAADALAAGHRGPRFVVDVHTTSSESPAYLSVDDIGGSVAFARKFPTHAVVGFERAVHGTLVEMLSRNGWDGVTFEAGRHHDLASVENARAAVWFALSAAGVVDEGDLPTDPRPADVLRRNAPEGGRCFDLIHRHAVGPADEFVMRPGFVNFQPVEEGQPLAHDARGPIAAPAGGRILMPLYQKLGDDGFFLIREREDDPA